MPAQSKPTVTMKQTTFNTKLEYDYNDSSEIKMEGHVFSWQNPRIMANRGWGIWQAVRRDSEIGQEVLKQMNKLGDRFAGMNNESDYFYQGSDLMLSVTTKELYDEIMERKRIRGENSLRSIDPDMISQTTIIPPTKGFVRRMQGGD